MIWTPQSLVAWVLNASRGTIEPTEPEWPLGLVDLRAKASKEHVYGLRTWKKVTGITLHQTACLLGERLGDDEPWRRWYGVGCHIGITRSGSILWLHDFDRLVVHGNGWNAHTVGIEIDGLYAGIQGDPRTVWDDPSTPRRETGMDLPIVQAAAARDAIRWIVGRVAWRKGKVRALVAHRQSSKNRRNDPGSAIWQSVALPLHAELGLSDGGDGFAIGTGYPVPREWDPNRTARY